ncbi:hypothetical protein LWI28_024742 [Acer negundo]|uniref:Transposase n=1 Tax=Acer negundo TaxID=4023 RepID=A0AAD5INN3_ACENE|nr:hypothetical protein LWI28_024742 [Acer negundo]
MKDPFTMMSLLIPGPQSPGKDIDIFLQPLVDELKELWHAGVETYDVSSRQNFQLHAVVLWTINDFPAYGDLSGWSTKGYMACPVCNEDTSSRKLRSKICYMGHRRFLPMNHPWRRSRKHDGDIEHRKAPTMRKRDAIVQQLHYVRHVKHIWDVAKREEEVEEQEEVVETTILEVEEEDLDDHQFHREDVEAQKLDPNVVFPNQNDDMDDIDDVNEDKILINYNNDDEEIVQNNDVSDIDV